MMAFAAPASLDFPTASRRASSASAASSAAVVFAPSLRRIASAPAALLSTRPSKINSITSNSNSHVVIVIQDDPSLISSTEDSQPATAIQTVTADEHSEHQLSDACHLSLPSADALTEESLQHHHHHHHPPTDTASAAIEVQQTSQRSVSEEKTPQLRRQNGWNWHAIATAAVVAARASSTDEVDNDKHDNNDQRRAFADMDELESKRGNNSSSRSSKEPDEIPFITSTEADKRRRRQQRQVQLQEWSRRTQVQTQFHWSKQHP